MACGGPPAPIATNRSEATVAVPDPSRFAQHTRIPPEDGELLLGAETADSSEVAVVLEAAHGRLVLFACDRVEAETVRNAFPLGQVGYERDGDVERIGGMVARRRLQRLIREDAPRIHTCEEEIELDEAQVRLLRAFLTSQPVEVDEVVDSIAISLEGLSVGVGISDRAPEVVRLDLEVRTGAPIDDDCLVETLVDGEPAALEEQSFGTRGRHVLVRLPRDVVRRWTAANEVGLTVCGELFVLDRMMLDTMRTLVN